MGIEMHVPRSMYVCACIYVVVDIFRGLLTPLRFGSPPELFGTVPPPPGSAAQPAYFFQCAANAAMMRRAAAQMIEDAGAPAECVAGPFVGQLVAAAGSLGLTDPQYVAFLGQEERKVPSSQEVGRLSLLCTPCYAHDGLYYCVVIISVTVIDVMIVAVISNIYCRNH
jgi:hypothetical protein